MGGPKSESRRGRATFRARASRPPMSPARRQIAWRLACIDQAGPLPTCPAMLWRLSEDLPTCPAMLPRLSEDLPTCPAMLPRLSEDLPTCPAMLPRLSEDLPSCPAMLRRLSAGRDS